MESSLAGLLASTVRVVTISVPLVVYTDGACSGNPGPGGWAWAVAPTGEPFASGGEERSTNQRMEICAALEAVRTLGPGNPRLEIVSDSTYVVHCFRDGWWEGWLKRGWRNSQKQPVANRDLWEPLIAGVRAHGGVTFRWVKGHSGDPMNDLVDRLAVAAAAGPFTASAPLRPAGDDAGDEDAPPTLF
jgi:ribonuclease HI